MVDTKPISEDPFKPGNATALTAIVSPCDALNPIILSADFLANDSRESKVKASASLVPFNFPLPLTDSMMTLLNSGLDSCVDAGTV